MKKVILFSCVTAFALNAQVFELGTVEVTATGGGKASDSNVVVLDSESLQKDEIKRLSEVAYTTAGIYVDKKGPRAEQNFYVRGFDARRVPMFIDGIPVYNPYDGSSDFGRFTTFDLSRIDISKGSSSVLYGANTMGGAINLVSKRPTKELEGNVGYGVEFGRSSGTFGNNIDFNIGSKQNLFYIQAGGSYMHDKGQQLSKDFKADSYGNEDGNKRDNSAQKDRKLSLKLGLTPNDSDEYTITYTNQKGEKEQPFYTGRYSTWTQQTERYWDWPVWDKEGVYFLSNTKLSSSVYLKTKLYYDTFKNNLNAYSNKAMTGHNNQNTPSYYDDYTYGGAIELGWDINSKNSLKFASTYKYDVHKERNDIYHATGVKLGEEPWQTTKDRTYTFGLEHSYNFKDLTKLITGISYDTKDAIEAQEFGRPVGAPPGNKLFSFDTDKQSAFNYQIALKHSFDGNDELSFSYAKKTYFASMKERYSERFGRFIPNPYLKPEVAHHYEITYGRTLSENFRFDSALFYSKVKDAIGNVGTGIIEGGRELQKAQNMDTAEYKGVELSLVYYPVKSLELGGNYTYMNSQMKNLGNRVNVFDLPKHKGHIYVDYKITPKFNVYLSQYMMSSFYSGSQVDTKMPGFGITNLKLTYKVTNSVSLDGGVRNLFDKNYEYREGFPEEGRVYFSNIRYTF